MYWVGVTKYRILLATIGTWELGFGTVCDTDKKYVSQDMQRNIIFIFGYKIRLDSVGYNFYVENFFFYEKKLYEFLNHKAWSYTISYVTSPGPSLGEVGCRLSNF